MSIKDYVIKHGDVRGGNIQKMLGNLDIYSETSMELIPKKPPLSKEVEKFGYKPVEGFAYPSGFEAVRETQSSDRPRLLIISDSFGENLFPILAENFSRSVKIFDAWQYKLNEEIVASENPDIVLLMIDEPILRNFLKFPSRTH